MYNHKIRGRPDDPRNKAISAAKKSLAQTIQVNSLSPFTKPPEPSELEVARSRQHYNEFKKHYALKHSTLSLRSPSINMPIIREAPNIDRYKLDKVTAPSSKASLKIVDSKLINARPPKRDTEVWVREPEPEYDGYASDTQALLLLEKLKAMESGYTSKTSQISQASQPSQNAATQSILEQAEKEASVAQEQLQAIQRLLMVDKSTTKPGVSLPTISEEEELHPLARRRKIVEDVKEKISQGKKKDMVMTLNTLNQRIQQMHEKYFNEPRTKYLSMKDVKRRVRLEKNIETLYKNEGFDPEREISEVLLQHRGEAPKAGKARARQGSSHDGEVVPPRVGKPVPIIRRSASIPVQKHQFTADVSSDNYLQNRDVHDARMAFEESLVAPEATRIESSSDRSWGDADSSGTQNDAANIGSIPSRYQSAKLDAILTPRSSTDNSCNTLSGIQESILRSEYLMKEFDITPHDLSSGLSNFESSMSVSRRTNSNSSSSNSRSSSSNPLRQSMPSVQEFFSATSQKSSEGNAMQRAFMADTIRTQLKNSLYDIF